MLGEVLAGGAATPTLARVARRRDEMCWAYLMAGMSDLSHHSRLAFLKLTASPDLRFAAYGGFLLLDDAGAVVAVQTVGGGADLPSGRRRRGVSSSSSRWPSFQPVTLPSLLRDGATHFCWLNAGEELKAAGASWVPAKGGAFLYKMKGRSPSSSPSA